MQKGYGRKKKQSTKVGGRSKAPVPVMSAPAKETMTTFTDVVSKVKGNIYSISRLREEEGYVIPYTLGTGFIIRQNTLVTCAHVINNPEATHPMQNHNDSDLYYLLQKDEFGNTHWYFITLELGKNLHIHDEVDFAIIDLPDDFYTTNGGRSHKNDHLKLAASPLPLGAEVGVLGYPIAEKGVAINGEDSSVDHRAIQPRVNKGVVNTRYRDMDRGLYMYQFTIPFNPGNSGGPIFDARNGEVIGMVKEFQTFPVQELVETFEIEKENGEKQVVQYPARIRASYSGGVALESFSEILKQHTSSGN